MELRKTFRFEASHILPKHPGKCSRLHGHSWVLHVHVEGPIDVNTGFVQDFADISAVVKPIVALLDHQHLGTCHWYNGGDMHTLDIPDAWKAPTIRDGLYPSSENLLWWIAGQLRYLDIWEMPRDVIPVVQHVEPGQIIDTDFPREIKRRSGWSQISIEETCTSMATLTRKEYDDAQRLRENA